jgi:hypothetical protein
MAQIAYKNDLLYGMPSISEPDCVYHLDRVCLIQIKCLFQPLKLVINNQSHYLCRFNIPLN